MLTDSDDAEERHALQTAYHAWVAEAQENGQNKEPDIFLAGWSAGRDWQVDRIVGPD